MNEEEVILEFLRNGKTYLEIARKIGISTNSVYMKISQIDKQKVEDAKNYNLRREEQEVLRLIEQGKTQTEIAPILGKSRATIINIIKRIDKDIVKQAKEKAKLNKENDDKTNESASSETEEMRAKLGQRILTGQDILNYREYIDKNLRNITVQEIVLMLNMYIKTGKVNYALKFINSLIDRKDIYHISKHKLQDIKIQVERAQNIQRARKLLKNNITVATVVYYTGLKEQEVMKLKEEIEAKKGMEI